MRNRHKLPILLSLIIILTYLNCPAWPPFEVEIQLKYQHSKYKSINLQSSKDKITHTTKKHHSSVSDMGVSDSEEEIFSNTSTLAQDDPKILGYIRKHHLFSPPGVPSPQLKHEGNPTQFKDQLDDLFGDTVNGTFIEVGANDGIFLSNTLALERDFGWSGLLIEPNKFVFSGLRRIRRNAWISNACLSTSRRPEQVRIAHVVGKAFNGMYRGAGFMEGSEHRDTFNGKSNDEGVMLTSPTACFPLYSLLSSIPLLRIGYFSLDVQGVEYKILATIPFEQVQIRVISVEHNIIPEGKEALRQLLCSQGYSVYYESESDFIFKLNKAKF